MSCEYCNKPEKVMHTEQIVGLCNIEVFLTGDCLEVNAYNHKTEYTFDMAFNLDVKYCPMCGEPLAEPKPLTLDELKERDGKPVWVVTPETGEEYWAIVGVNKFNVDLFSCIAGDGGAYELYGISWLAYDRKPKEDADGK